MTGDGEVFEITATNRNQFTEFQGAPVLNLISFDAPIQRNKAYGGLFISNQKKGISSNTHAMATYGYRLNFADEVFLKFGFALGILDQSVNYSKLMVTNIADPYLFLTEQRKTNFDGNAGFAFYAKGFTIGASVPQIFASKLEYKDVSGTRAYYQMSRHFMGNLQFDLNLNRDIGMKLSPLALVRFVQNAPLQFDAGLKFALEEKFWVTALYRNNFALGFQGGVILNRRFALSYSYDYMIGDISSYAGMSHEIMLAVKLGKLKPKRGEDTLTEQDKKIIELQKQINELKKNGVKSDVSSAQNKPTEGTVKAERRVFTEKNSTKEDGIYINTFKASDFSFSSGAPVKKGYYMIVETVFYLDYAEEEMKRYSNFSFPDADIIVEKKSKFYYVYVYTADNKEDAIKLAKEALKSGAPDCWIHHLTE